MRNDWFFGKIPASWKIAPLKYQCSRSSVYGANISAENYANEGVRFLRTTDILEDGSLSTEAVYVDYTIVKDYILEPGDLLLSRSGTLGRSYVHRESNGSCAYAGYLVKFVPDKTTNPFYVFYLTKTAHFTNWLNYSTIASTIGNINGEKFSNCLIPVPDIETQNAIVSFLNKEVKEIENLLNVKEKQLLLLAEKRQAIITKFVTKGLDPTVKCKDSGLDWLGEIPEHWAIKKVKYLTSKVGSGVTPKGGATVYQKSGVPLLRSQNIHFDGLAMEEVAYISESIHETMENSKVLPGDVLLNITGASIGRCYYYSGELGEANVNQHVCILRPNDSVLTAYLNLLLSSNIGQDQVEVFQIGGGREGLTFESIKSFIFPLPETSEQMLILEHVGKFEEEIAILRKSTERSIELLHDRQLALITSAVTGQLEIP